MWKIVISCCASILIGSVLDVAAQAVQDQNQETIDKLINDIFTTPAPILTVTLPSNDVELPPGVPLVDNCPGGECVPFYLCSDNGSFITTGEGIFDRRFGLNLPLQCRDYMQTCCGIEDVGNNTNVQLPVSTENKGCGLRNPNGLLFETNKSNSSANFAEFPWMMAIVKEERINGKIMSIYQCGGSLIHPQVVLTAAHCVRPHSPNDLIARAGEWDTQTEFEISPHQQRRIAKITVHPQYYAGGLFNDIALLFLSEPFTFAPNVQTVCLPPQDLTFDYNRCFASGWGKDVFGRQGIYQVILKKVELPIIPRNQCESKFRTTRLSRRFKLHDSFICAGGEAGIDTCKGDGGSPLVCGVPGSIDRYYQAGIVAWGIGCGENGIPGAYANVAKFRNWIDQQMAQNGFDGQYYEKK